MKTNRTDLWDEELFVGDLVKVGLNSYVIRYGNFKHLGVDKIGIFLQNTKILSDTFPLAQAKILVKIND